MVIKENYSSVNFSELYFSLQSAWSIVFTIGSFPEKIAFYYVVKCFGKFAWVYFWRAHNKPTRDMNDATYKNRTSNCSLSPRASLKQLSWCSFLARCASFYSWNRYDSGLVQTASFAMGSEPHLKLTFPESCGTFIFSQFFLCP